MTIAGNRPWLHKTFPDGRSFRLAKVLGPEHEPRVSGVSVLFQKPLLLAHIAYNSILSLVNNHPVVQNPLNSSGHSYSVEQAQQLKHRYTIHVQSIKTLWNMKWQFSNTWFFSWSDICQSFKPPVLSAVETHRFSRKEPDWTPNLFWMRFWYLPNTALFPTWYNKALSNTR